MIKTFDDVEIERNVDVSCLRWPEPGEAMDDCCLGCNRAYADLRGLTWREASELLAAEEELLSGYESTGGLPEDSEESDDDEEHFSLLSFIDEGVAGVVAALSAARCIPCSSCNAGALGGQHHEFHPLVAFYVRSQHVPLLLKAAETSDVGLTNGLDGALVVYSGDVRRMLAFARELLAFRKEFRQLRFRAKGTTIAIDQTASETMVLPFDDLPAS